MNSNVYVDYSWVALTKKETMVLGWIVCTCSSNRKILIQGLYRRISLGLGITPNAARGRVRSLEKKGFIFTQPSYERQQVMGIWVNLANHVPGPEYFIKQNFKMTEEERIKRFEMKNKEEERLKLKKEKATKARWLLESNPNFTGVVGPFD